MSAWTVKEIDILKENYNKVSNRKLYELLPNKTETAIYKKAYKIGLRKTKEIEHLNRSLARQGENCRFWKGGKTKTSKGYKLVKMPEHHRANNRGYVLEHIVVWEKTNLQRVPDGYVVHHINGIKTDNRPENLQLMTTSEHSIYHNQFRIYSDETKRKISQKMKERLSLPENHPSYKNVDVLQMQKEIDEGKTVKSVCEKYGIDKTTYYKKIKRIEV